MTSRGAAETKQLKENVQSQLNRLLSQLDDLKELKEDLDEDEYNEIHKDTMEQLDEFNSSLKKMMSGDVGLVNELASVQLAIQAAVSKAFSTPEVIRMFAKREPGNLRARLSDIDQQHQLGKLPKATYTQQKLEILAALQRLKEELTAEQQAFLSANQTAALADFTVESLSLSETVASAGKQAAKK